ncbi:hypothetical protein ACSW8S_18395 (plasmid) [Clostridium perfringens]
MDELLDLIEQLTSDNLYINEYIEKNIELLKTSDNEELNSRNINFHKFLNEHSIRNNRFKFLMESLGLSSINDIKNNQINSNKDVDILLKNFSTSITNAQTTLNLYSKLINSELNMINKIKHFKQSSKLDFKV